MISLELGPQQSHLTCNETYITIVVAARGSQCLEIVHNHIDEIFLLDAKSRDVGTQGIENPSLKDPQELLVFKQYNKFCFY